MTKSTYRGAVMDSSNIVGQILNKLGTWGFVLRPVESERIANIRPLTADQFAVEVLIAEGLNPDYEIEFRRSIRNFFIEQVGTDMLEE